MSIAHSFKNALMITDPGTDLRVEIVKAFEPSSIKSGMCDISTSGIRGSFIVFKDKSFVIFLSDKTNEGEIHAYESPDALMEDEEMLALFIYMINQLEKESAESQTP